MIFTEGDKTVIPIQIQIRFRRPGEQKDRVRVFTVTAQATPDREIAETGIVCSVLATHAIRQAARMTEASRFQEAQEMLMTSQKMMKRGAKTPTQTEELSIFMGSLEKLAALTQNLQHGRRDDATLASIQKLRNASQVTFMAGTRKDVTKRKKHVKKQETLVDTTSATASSSSSSSTTTATTTTH
jgi:hypothetical protein